VAHHTAHTISQHSESDPFRIQDDHTYTDVWKQTKRSGNKQYHTVQGEADISRQSEIFNVILTLIYTHTSFINI
jgi:hypothetical protein